MTLPTSADYRAIAERLHSENTLLKIERAQLQMKLDNQRERIERMYAKKMQEPDYLNTVVDNLLNGPLLVTEYDLIEPDNQD
jgi:regulator of replication initiation timing